MRSIRRITLAVATAAIGAALIAPAASQATVTIGSNLARAPQLGPDCGSADCTFALSALDDPTFAAPNGIVSPTNGTITRWRIRTGLSADDTNLQVVTPRPGGTYVAAAQSAVVTPATSSISEFATSVPISAGDLIGIDCCDSTGSYFRISDGDTLQWQAPGLAGTPEAPDDNEGELLINADIEPTSAFQNTKPKAKKGKVKFIATLPNAGTIAAGDPKDKKLKGVAAKAAKGPQLLTRTSKRLNAAGKVKLSVKLSKAAQKRLAANGKLSVRVRVVFTPDGGSSSQKTLKVKFAK